MNAAIFALVALAALTPGVGHAGQPIHVAKAELIAAARHTPVRLIDALEIYCDSDTQIGDWLQRLTAREARQVAWSARPCELVNSLNPNDAGGDYCVQATVMLLRPKDRRDRPEIEIYFEDPKHGRPGAVYAFRAIFDSIDGPDYIRFRKDFEGEWRDRFKETPPAACSDDP